MKIDPTRPAGAAPAASPTGPARGGDAGFVIPKDTTPSLAQTAGLKAAGGVLAPLGVLALQGLGDDRAQKRARQVRRGHDSLDALERLKLGLLEGRAPGEVRATLHRLFKERDETGDATLDHIMEDIDVRVAVELAKLERRSA
jgi:hypothetical protein